MHDSYINYPNKLTFYRDKAFSFFKFSDNSEFLIDVTRVMEIVHWIEVKETLFSKAILQNSCYLKFRRILMKTPEIYNS